LPRGNLCLCDMLHAGGVKHRIHTYIIICKLKIDNLSSAGTRAKGSGILDKNGGSKLISNFLTKNSATKFRVFLAEVLI
jgi:hypothetical protein